MSDNSAPREPSGPVVLAILDGWGIGRDEPGNAILAADTPTMDRLWATYPHATLRCSGEDVGLPAGQMGNSEVGHLNLGAGFVVYQWITRIDRAIADGEFQRNPTLLAAIAHARESGGALHLLGLVSTGGVHSHIRHLDALLRLAKEEGLTRVYLHAMTDGRDTSPKAGLDFVSGVERTMGDLGVGSVASVSGRYYAMDRDHRWERTRLAYDAIVQGAGPQAVSAADAIRHAYDAGVTDEFIVPTVIVRSGRPVATVQPGDSIVYFNFRADRGRQLTEALTTAQFDKFPNADMPPDVYVATLTRYEGGLAAHVAFPPQDVVCPVARAVSERGLAQFHTAETEKYAHVTFFYNGGREEPFPGEERTLIPSPKVATYDLQPEMSARGVASAVVAAVRSGNYPLVIVNFANCDMVGHTGDFAAAVKAVETVDRCLADILEAIRAVGGTAIVTADHGNAEEMVDRATGQPMTAHTTNPVPVILVAPDGHRLRDSALRQDGILCQVAPTVLDLLGVPIPSDMTVPSLFSPGNGSATADTTGDETTHCVRHTATNDRA